MPIIPRKGISGRVFLVGKNKDVRRSVKHNNVRRGVKGRAEVRADKVRAEACADKDKVRHTVVFTGNPNVGKTTLFNAITKSHFRTGNYHGVTCSPNEKTIGNIIYKDVPGMYSLNGYTMEEASAAAAVAEADLIVVVLDCTVLPTCVRLAEELTERRGNVIIFLTKTDVLKKRGGMVDTAALTQYFGVPVVGTLKELKAGLSSGKFFLENLKTAKCRTSLEGAYYGGNSKISRGERLFYNKYFALAFYVAALLFTFFITFHPAMPGAKLKEFFQKFFTAYLPNALFGGIRNEVLKSLVFDGIVGGVGGVLSFIPQIAILQFTLIVLDESGIASALSFVTDGLFRKVGLSGKAAFSLMSGFGCTAAAIATTRGFERESSRKKLIFVLPFIPCGAKLPLFFAFLSPLFKNPFPPICVLYLSGVALTLIFSALTGGGDEGLIAEVTPISFPHASILINKLCFQIKSFIIKVTTYVFVFCVVGWFLTNFSFTFSYCNGEESMAGVFSGFFRILFYPMGITDWRIAYAALTGFAAKENVAATLAMLIPEGLSLGIPQSAAICAFFLCCPACISAFAASAREVGFVKTLKYNLLQLCLAFVFSYMVYFIFSII